MTQLTSEDYCRLFAAEQRRVVLDVLAGRSSPVDLDELVAGVAARDDDGDENAGASAPSTTAVQLHHNHLPRLDEAGLVRYDPDDRSVEATDLTGEVDDLLAAVQQE